jgi:hypothetical protein
MILAEAQAERFVAEECEQQRDIIAMVQVQDP